MSTFYHITNTRSSSKFIVYAKQKRSPLTQAGRNQDAYDLYTGHLILLRLLFPFLSDRLQTANPEQICASNPLASNPLALYSTRNSQQLCRPHLILTTVLLPRLL